MQEVVDSLSCYCRGQSVAYASMRSAEALQDLQGANMSHLLSDSTDLLSLALSEMHSNSEPADLTASAA